MSLLLALTVAGGAPVPISGSDSAVGTEGAGTILATLTISDTGSGADNGTPRVTLTVSDAGSGLDTPALSVTLGSSDAGSGTDDGSVTFKMFFASDTGAGVDGMYGLEVRLLSPRTSRLQSAASAEQAAQAAAGNLPEPRILGV